MYNLKFNYKKLLEMSEGEPEVIGWDANGSPVYEYKFDPREDLIHHNQD